MSLCECWSGHTSSFRSSAATTSVCPPLAAATSGVPNIASSAFKSTPKDRGSGGQTIVGEGAITRGPAGTPRGKNKKALFARSLNVPMLAGDAPWAMSSSTLSRCPPAHAAARASTPSPPIFVIVLPELFRRHSSGSRSGRWLLHEKNSFPRKLDLSHCDLTKYAYANTKVKRNPPNPISRVGK